MINQNENPNPNEKDIKEYSKSSTKIENEIVNSNLENTTKSEIRNNDEEENYCETDNNNNDTNTNPNSQQYTIPSGSFIKKEENYMQDIPYTKYEFENFSYFNFQDNKNIFIINDKYKVSTNHKYIIPIELSHSLRYSITSEQETKITEFSCNRSKLVISKVNSLVNELNKYMIVYIEKDFIRINDNINSKILKIIWVITSLILLLIPAFVLLFIIDLDYLYKKICISLSCFKVCLLIYMIFHRLKAYYLKSLVLLECFLMKERQFLYFISKWNGYLRQFNYKIQVSADFSYVFLIYYHDDRLLIDSSRRLENNEIEFSFEDK